MLVSYTSTSSHAFTGHRFLVNSVPSPSLGSRYGRFAGVDTANVQCPIRCGSKSRLSMQRNGVDVNWEEIQNNKTSLQLNTVLRVAVPAFTASLLAALVYPNLALGLAYWIGDTANNGGVFAVLSQDSSQFVQNFLTVSSLLFSILVGQTYYFLYLQQESIYYALFDEVTEAKSLLEQVSLVCRGRSSMYQQLLKDIRRYVRDDLLPSVDKNPAESLSSRPVDDPLESVLYWTSVGVPSSVYDTVKSLRAARASRLGALQRKLPAIHMAMLWMLAAMELCSFPLLGAGTQTLGGYNLLTVQGILFGTMTFGIVTTLTVRICPMPKNKFASCHRSYFSSNSFFVLFLNHKLYSLHTRMHILLYKFKTQ